MTLNPKNRNLAITVALGGAVVAYIVLIFLPTQKSIASLQADLAAQQTTIGRSQSLSTALTELDGRLQAASKFSASWQADAPSARHRAPALGAVTRCATEAGVATLQFDPRPNEPLATVARIPISLTCEGTFAQVVDLLQRLEALPATIWIENMRVAAQRGDAEIVHCELNLVVFADNQESSG